VGAADAGLGWAGGVPGVDARKAQVRRLDVQDLDACLGSAEDPLWACESARWRLLLDLGGGYGIDDPGGGLAGTVFLTEVAQGIGVVGMLLIARRHGGRGLGLRLMEEALGAAAGAAVFLYTTEAGRPLYAKLGFRVLDTVTAYAGSCRRAGGPPRATDLRAARRNLDTVHAGPLVADSMSTAKALLDVVLPEGTATASTSPAQPGG
jgi:GNAT superfamily N-acetyltransferase